MRKVLKKSFFALLVVGAFACNKPKAENVEREVSIENVMESILSEEGRFVWPDSVEDILIIPDSIIFADTVLRHPYSYWNEEQKALAKKITKAMLEGMVVENKRTVVKISRKEFMKFGIPEPYYDLLLQNIKDLNRFEEADTAFANKNEAEMKTMLEDIQRELLEVE